MAQTLARTNFELIHSGSVHRINRMGSLWSSNLSGETSKNADQLIRFRRRQLLLAAGALVVPRLSMAAQRGRISRIAFLSLTTPQNHRPQFEALRAGLREYGYVEGKNIVIESRWAEGIRKRLPGLAAELVKLQPDVIVTGGRVAIRAAKQATATIPIVMAVVGDPVANGLVATLARPGGNITGSTYFLPELSAKRLEILRDALPKLRRVAVLLNRRAPPERPTGRIGPTLIEAERAAGLLQLSLQYFYGRNRGEIESAFSAMSDAGMEAVSVLDSPGMTAQAEWIAQLAAKARLPSIGFPQIAIAGGLMGYGVDFLAMYRRVAFFVDKILTGTNPGEIPIERATRFEFVVNLKTARALGISLPAVVMVRADRVIR